MSVAARLLATIRAAVPAVTDVSIGQQGQAATVKVAPASEQAAALTAINGFDWSPAAQIAWEEGQQPERQTLRQAAAQAIVDIDTYLAIGSPNNSQVVAQVRKLSQQNKQIIKRLIQVD